MTNSYYVYYPASTYLYCGDTFIDYAAQKYTLSFFKKSLSSGYLNDAVLTTLNFNEPQGNYTYSFQIYYSGTYAI